MHRLIYVSESKLSGIATDAEVSQMVGLAQKRNAELNVTGALMFTGTHFAQVLEGPQSAIEELMISISRDLRHSSILITDKSRITSRQFPTWQLAYQGPSQFVSFHLTRLLHPTPASEQKRATEWLIQLAIEFTNA